MRSLVNKYVIRLRDLIQIVDVNTQSSVEPDQVHDHRWGECAASVVTTTGASKII